MDSGGSPALAESEADGVVSSSYQRRLFAERAAILVDFSFASASLVVLVAVLILAVVETPTFALTSADRANPWLAASYFGAWFAYFVFAATQFYPGHRA